MPSDIRPAPPWLKAELSRLFLKPFLQGYQSQNNLPPEEYSRLETFLNYRRFLMFALFYEQIKEGDPDYLEVFRQDILSGTRYLPVSIESLLN
ncbi:MAG TPA: hypothetical protein PLC91_00765 [Candidatus Cloacimonadota bacterium]|nr:hypothetical protein [Candidatus Cloacimonadota bacterium]HQH50190.1 hypothetical protein [Candidatus Cloacimonadota bacterium]